MNRTDDVVDIERVMQEVLALPFPGAMIHGVFLIFVFVDSQ